MASGRLTESLPHKVGDTLLEAKLVLGCTECPLPPPRLSCPFSHRPASALLPLWREKGVSGFIAVFRQLCEAQDNVLSWDMVRVTTPVLRGDSCVEHKLPGRWRGTSSQVLHLLASV